MESSETPTPDQPESTNPGPAQHSRLVRYARPALIAGAVVAVVCLVLLVIIFLLDSFNATVYSVGGKNISDASEEARQIRDLYLGARVGGLVVLIVSVVIAAVAAVVLVREQRKAGDADGDGGEDLGFDELAVR
jgi:ABC-type Fe3+ transport system permease subunit